MIKDKLDKLQEMLGYNFNDVKLLEKALTHSSAEADINYERLEFLGDRILGLVIAEEIFEKFPEEKEGDLAKRHAALVQGRTLSEIGASIDIGNSMNLSDSERASGGADNENIIADAVESVIAAIYLDSGLEICAKIVKKLFGDRVNIMTEPPQDPKTALQEWAQARGLGLPKYDIVSQEGPDHSPIFEIKVEIEGHPAITSSGASRRKAEKEAASTFLKYLNETG